LPDGILTMNAFFDTIPELLFVNS